MKEKQKLWIKKCLRSKREEMLFLIFMFIGRYQYDKISCEFLINWMSQTCSTFDTVKRNVCKYLYFTSTSSYRYLFRESWSMKSQTPGQPSRIKVQYILTDNINRQTIIFVLFSNDKEGILEDRLICSYLPDNYWTHLSVAVFSFSYLYRTEIGSDVGSHYDTARYVYHMVPRSGTARNCPCRNCC